MTLRGQTLTRSGVRMPAGDLERLVLKTLADWLANAGAVIEALDIGQSEDAIFLPKEAAALGARLAAMGRGEQAALLAVLCERIDLGERSVVLALSASALLGHISSQDRIAPEPGKAGVVKVTVRIKTVRTGGACRLLVPDDESPIRVEPDPAILRALARAHDWAARIFDGDAPSLAAIARQDGVTPRYIARLLPLAFLAPDLVERIMRGGHSAALTAETLTRDPNFPANWKQQNQHWRKL